MYILTHPNLFPSARVIKSSILQKTSKKLFIKLEQEATPPSIRWGNSHNHGANDTVLNSASLIRTCSNKRLFSTLLTDNRVAHVQYHKGFTPDRFPVVVRTVVNGMGGEGIVVCFDREDFEAKYSNSLWSYWYKFTFELGVHVLGGEIVRVFKKVREDGASDEEFPIRNFHRGYSFSLRDASKYEKLKGVVDLFYSIMPIQMTRLDIGWDAEEKTYRIIEANTAPSLSANENTLDIYTDFLIERLGL